MCVCVCVCVCVFIEYLRVLYVSKAINFHLIQYISNWCFRFCDISAITAKSVKFISSSWKLFQILILNVSSIQLYLNILINLKKYCFEKIITKNFVKKYISFAHNCDKILLKHYHLPLCCHTLKASVLSTGRVFFSIRLIIYSL